MHKRRIGLVTNWYPTEQNPYRGSFFKEQAFALSDHFDFDVIHYSEKFVPSLIYWFQSLLGKNYSISKVREECNTVEFIIQARLPLYLGIINKIYTPYARRIKHLQEPGIGKYESRLYQNAKKILLKKIFTTAFSERLDILYCVNAQAESSTVRWIAQALDKPYIVAEHAPFPWPGTTLRDSEKDAIENADAFLAISYDKVRQVMLQNVNPRKIAYVGNMVNDAQFTPALSNTNEKTFVTVAAHTFYKNYPLFIQIFNRLTEITSIPFKVMIVGYGANKGYSKDADILEQKIKASKFGKHAVFIPSISRDQIHEVYRRADAFVMTSVQEGMPVSALEAGCCGLPIFSTMCGGVEDYVNRDIGRIYKIIDCESFAFGLKDFLEGNLSFDKQHIRETIVGTYGTAAFVKNMADIIHSAIDSHNR